MEYTIQKAVFDSGKNIDWESVPAAKIGNVCWGYGQPDVAASAKLCYDCEKLYVRLSAKEKDIRAEFTGLYGMPCEDSCLEFFFVSIIRRISECSFFPDPWNLIKIQ